MDKSKISKKQKFSFNTMPAIGQNNKIKTLKHDPKRGFKNRQLVSIALLQALENNDPEAFVEILDGYLQVNRTEIAKKAHLARSTVQLALSKGGNPTARTLAKIVHQAVAA
jgi:DNA-binding phage protein